MCMKNKTYNFVINEHRTARGCFKRTKQRVCEERKDEKRLIYTPNVRGGEDAHFQDEG